MLWEAWNSDIEVVAVVFLCVSNEINSMGKATFNRLPDICPSWWVASQSKNVATPMFFRGLGKDNVIQPTGDEKNVGGTRTARAMSIFSGFILVHVKCMHVSRPIVP